MPATTYGYSLCEPRCRHASAHRPDVPEQAERGALNRTATASSAESAATGARAAVDGDTGTRWSSAFSEPQWIQVDLGSGSQICAG